MINSQNVVISVLAAGLLTALVGCSSSSARTTADTDEPNVVGTYAASATVPAAAVAWLQLEANQEYVMLKGDSATGDDAESGTYTLNAGLSQVTFTPDGGVPSTHAFAVASTATGGQSTTMVHDLVLVAPISGALVKAQAQSLTVDGASVQLVDGVQMECPDGSRLIFPDLSSGIAGTKGSGCRPRASSGF